MKSGELGDRKLLGAGVRAEIYRGEGFASAIGFGESPQIIDQSFALLRETQFHKIQEVRCAAEGELCALTGQAERDEGGSDFRRRVESVARDFEDEFGARVELRDDGKIAIIARARLRGEAKRDFGLNDDVYFVDEAGESEQVMKNRRGDVVGKIAVDADAAAGSDSGDVGFENVAADDGEIGELFCEMPQAGQERRIDFDGVDGGAGSGEVLGHFTVPRTNFDPAMLVTPMNRGSQTTLVPGKRRDGMGRNANGARNLFAPMKIAEEVLAEALASDGGTV